MVYNLHQIFLMSTTIINLVTIISSGYFGFKNFNTNLKKEIVYSSLGIFILTLIIMGLLIAYKITNKIIFFSILIAFYVILSINIGLLFFFSFYRYKLTDHISETQESIFGIMIATFFFSLLFFLLSDQYLLTKIDKGFKDIDTKNYKSKIVEYNQIYSPERTDYIYVEKSTLKTKNNDYYNVINLPTKIDDCKIRILKNNCFFKDSDLFKKDGNFSDKIFTTMGIDRKYKNKTLKNILDKFFMDIIYSIKEGNTIAFPKGEWLFDKAPLITKYVDQYKDYLLLLSETYDEDLSIYFSSNVLLTPEAIYKIKPNLNSIRDESIQERRKQFISMAAKSSGMDECDFISTIIGKRKGKHDEKLVNFMMTLVKDLNCHDEKKIELAKNLSVKYKSPLEAQHKISNLKNIFHNN